jgi:Transcription factor WhiB
MCSRLGCDKRVYARGICRTHYDQARHLSRRSGKPPQFIQREPTVDWIDLVVKVIRQSAPLPGAACTRADPRLFDYHEGDPAPVAALQICQTCPVLSQCRQFAHQRGDLRGVVGGEIWLDGHAVQVAV